MNNENGHKSKINGAPVEAPESIAGVTRRAFVGTAALAGSGFATLSAAAQTREELLAGRQGNSASDPGPKNQPLITENPNSHRPPFTDHGNMWPIWYSFDLPGAEFRAEDGRTR